MTFTTHGHHIAGSVDDGVPFKGQKARCGGPDLCVTCSQEAAQFRKDLVASFTGKTPELDAVPESLKEGKTVPLVIYIGETRKIVGTATVYGDNIIGHLDEEKDEGLAKLIQEGVITSASLSFKTAGPAYPAFSLDEGPHNRIQERYEPLRKMPEPATERDFPLLEVQKFIQDDLIDTDDAEAGMIDPPNHQL